MPKKFNWTLLGATTLLSLAAVFPLTSQAAGAARVIFAAGDVTGRLLLVPPAIQDGFVAATNAVRGPTMTCDPGPSTQARPRLSRSADDRDSVR